MNGCLLMRSLQIYWVCANILLFFFSFVKIFSCGMKERPVLYVCIYLIRVHVYMMYICRYSRVWTLKEWSLSCFTSLYLCISQPLSECQVGRCSINTWWLNECICWYIVGWKRIDVLKAASVFISCSRNRDNFHLWKGSFHY